MLATVDLALPNMVSLQTSRKWVLEKLKTNLLESSEEKEKKENETALAISPVFKKFNAIYDSCSF